MVEPFSVKITDNIPELKALLKRAGERNIKEATFFVHKTLVGDVLTGNRTGRTYRIPGGARGVKKKTYYTASAPGEAPARRTGALATDYKPTVKGFVGAVGAMLLYALMLEKGTKGKGKGGMAPRPHLSVAFRMSRDDIIRILSKEYL